MATLVVGLSQPSAKADVIDFTSAPTGGPVGRLGPVTFSSGLDSSIGGFDGFYPGSSIPASQYVYNGYGVNNEYFVFDAPVRFDSLVVDTVGFLADSPDSLTIKMLDASGSLVASHTVGKVSWQTVSLGVEDVSKVVLSFTGGRQYRYGPSDTTYRAWYAIDTISYTPMASVSGPAVTPLPAAAWGGLALFGMVGGKGLLARRRKPTAVA